MKDPKCKICGGPHYKTFCFNAPKKPIQSKPITYTTIKPKPLKQALTKPKPTNSRRKRAVAKLDRIFSIYIRLKDAISGKARCVTCGRTDRWENMQNGHFIPRARIGTRWHEDNCHVQCAECNMGLSGNMPKYRQYIADRYGEHFEDYLKQESTKPINVVEIEELIEHYNSLVKKLK